jgi:hypothetical protein
VVRDDRFVLPIEVANGWLVVEVPDLVGRWASHGVAFIYIGRSADFTDASLSQTLAKTGFVIRRVIRAAEPGIDAVRARVRKRLRASSFDNGYPAWTLKLVKAVLGV